MTNSAQAKIGIFTVTTDLETFRIFPKGRDGKSRPVTKVNQFLHLTGPSGNTITFKRYLHRKEWYYRVSYEAKPLDELQIRDEIARLLFPVEGLRDGEGRRAGDRVKAEELMRKWRDGKVAA